MAAQKNTSGETANTASGLPVPHEAKRPRTRKQRRRGAGEGTIYQRTDGRWTAQASVGWHNGKRSRRQVYGKSFDDVRVKLRELQTEAAQGTLPPAGRETVAEFLTYWFESVARPNLRPASAKVYDIAIRVHLIPELGNKQLKALKPEDVQDFIKRKSASGKAASTVQTMRTVLRRALRQAEIWGRVPRNVARLVDPPRIAERGVVTLSSEAARAFLTVAGTTRYAAFYTIVLGLGLRLGEALALRWPDVDLDAGELTIRASLARYDGALRLQETKTRTSRRTLALPRFCVVALQMHRDIQLLERKRADTLWATHYGIPDFVFTTPAGEPVDPRVMQYHWTRMLRDAGIPHMRIHDLRHTAATLMLAEGIDLKTISETLGHSKLTVTADIYLHPDRTLRKRAAEGMDNLLGEGSKDRPSQARNSAK